MGKAQTEPDLLMLK